MDTLCHWARATSSDQATPTVLSQKMAQVENHFHADTKEALGRVPSLALTSGLRHFCHVYRDKGHNMSLPMTRMLKNKKVISKGGREVRVRLFDRGKFTLSKQFLVTKGKLTVLETDSESEASEALIRAIDSIQRGILRPRKKRIIIFRG